MVGYHPGKNGLTRADVAVAGAVSGVLTRAIIQPIDVIKIRIQLQVEPVKPGTQSKYHSIPQALRSIVIEEGTSALWKGHIPAQILSVVYGITQFVAFETLTKAVVQYLPEQLGTEFRPATHFLCGGVSGCFATVSSQPFDVIRTRLIAQGEPKVYPTMTHAYRLIVRHEGVRALYKGLLPALIAIGPQSGFQFGFYTMFSDIWKFAAGNPLSAETGPVGSLACGSAAGICAKVAVYPLDLAKKRLQVQGFDHGRKSFGRTDVYSGLIDCIRRISQVEGLSALYKGLSASLLKAAVSSACIFTFYEQCCLLLALRHKR